MQLLKCAGSSFCNDNSARGTGPTIHVIIISVSEFLGVSTSLSSSHSKIAAIYLAFVMYFRLVCGATLPHSEAHLPGEAGGEMTMASAGQFNSPIGYFNLTNYTGM